MDGQAKVTLLLELKNKLKGTLDTARKFVSDNVEGMKEKLKGLKSSYVETFSAMKDQIPGLGNALSLISNPITGIIAGVVALTGVFASAKAQAEQWDTSLAKVNVTAQLGKEDLHGLGTEIMDIAKRNTIPLQEVPSAFNRIISAGLDTNTALQTLEPTLQAAKAGFTDVETTAMAAVSVMNSSGVMDANRVYDVLFATLNRGNAEFKDIAQYLPKIIPMAKAAGFSLEQVAGSFAFLTAQGMSSEQSSTGLSNLFKSLSDDSIINGGKGKLGLKGLGIDVFTATGEMKPLIEIIDQLKQKTDGLTSESKVKFFDQIGFDMETSTAIASMTQNVDKLRENIDFVTNSQGQLGEAYKNSATAGDGWAKVQNEITAAMIEVGQPISDTFGALGNEILPYIQTGLETMKNLLSGVWEAISFVGSIAWSLIKPFVNIVKVILDAVNHSTILKDIFWALGKVMDAISWAFGKVGDAISAVYENTIKPIFDFIDGAYTKMKELLGFSSETTPVPVTAGVTQIPVGPNPFGTAGMVPMGPKDFSNGSNAYGFQDHNLYAGLTPPKVTKPPKDKKDKGGTSISGKAEQVRNITIHAQNIGISGDIAMKGNANGEALTKKDVADLCNELFARFVHNLETSYE
jgi:TP901 family phage tail tape measure protein